MKAVAASSISEYEAAVAALGDYYDTVERGLGACFRVPGLQPLENIVSNKQNPACVVVFGTDQGLVGQFNDTIADFTMKTLAASHVNAAGQASTPAPLVWAVGERVYERLSEAGLNMQTLFEVPASVKAITPLVGEILLDIETRQPLNALTQLHLFYHRPAGSPAYQPISQRLLPLDEHWGRQLAEKPWPAQNLPELLGDKTDTLRALIREYLFVSLYRASAESLASENASRLAAMQRADKNIEELLATLRQRYHSLRQANIDAEMFDVLAGSNLS
jgi:F-type H+-transporting ATPase subunit gamma